MTRYVFITGGVVSSLGKGIASASLAAALEARGLKVTLLKLDPYINVDPGTMSPFQHGEVYVGRNPYPFLRIFLIDKNVPNIHRSGLNLTRLCPGTPSNSYGYLLTIRDRV